jgi:signal transduction histidine kinase
MKQLNTIKNQLTISFFSLSLISIGVFAGTFFYLDNLTKLNEISDTLEKSRLAMQRAFRLRLELLDHGLLDPAFYTQGQSLLLREHNQEFTQSQTLLKKARQLPQIDDFGINGELDHIEADMASYKPLLDTLVAKSQEQGHRDYGLEGKMRRYAHELEAQLTEGELATKLLMLRRNEKDFLLRRDQQYLVNFGRLVAELSPKLKSKPEAQALLFSYQATFVQLVAAAQKIGKNSPNSLYQKVNSLSSAIEGEFGKLYQQAEERQLALIGQLKRVYLISLALLVLGSLGLAFYMARRTAKPIRLLTKWVEQHQEAEPTIQFPEIKKAPREVTYLLERYYQLLLNVRHELSVSEQKSQELATQNQMLEKLNHELDQFIYSTSHDLKGPLSSVLGLINIMRIERDPASFDHYLKMMERSVNNLLQSVNNIVNIGKNIRTEVRAEEIDLQKMTEDIFVTHAFYEYAQVIERAYSVRQLCPFSSDYVRLNIIMNNLITNAIKYHNPNQPNPRVEISGEISSARAIINVSDNGSGIAPEHLGRVFDIFYRANETRSGSGLGLYMVKEMVQKLGGEIQVESKLGKGTTFTLSLPNFTPQSSADQSIGRLALA